MHLNRINFIISNIIYSSVIISAGTNFNYVTRSVGCMPSLLIEGEPGTGKTTAVSLLAKLFKSRIKFLPARKGERYASALSSMSLNNKVNKSFGKIKLKDYIENFVKKHKKNH